MYLPNTEWEHWAVFDPVIAPIPSHWKSSQLLICFSLSCKEYLSFWWKVDTQRGERSRSPKDIVSQAELNMPGLVKNNLIEDLSFFTFTVAEMAYLETPLSMALQQWDWYLGYLFLHTGWICCCCLCCTCAPKHWTPFLLPYQVCRLFVNADFN